MTYKNRPSIVALIPARSGSKRVPHKNIKVLKGHPLLAYTIQAAIDSGVYDSVVCCTDNELYADVAKYYGAEVPFLRPAEMSGDTSPDIEWVSWALNSLKSEGRDYEAFSILRPTSPFRTPKTIQKAYDLFLKNREADSLRAIEKCAQHPGKMWVINNNRMSPILPFKNGDTPWHSNQYNALPEIYIQNASLEIAWSRLPMQLGSIAGEVIVPFITEGLEGFDINHTEDWLLAEHYVGEKKGLLPKIVKSLYKL